MKPGIRYVHVLAILGQQDGYHVVVDKAGIFWAIPIEAADPALPPGTDVPYDAAMVNDNTLSVLFDRLRTKKRTAARVAVPCRVITETGNVAQFAATFTGISGVNGKPMLRDGDGKTLSWDRLDHVFRPDVPPTVLDDIVRLLREARRAHEAARMLLREYAVTLRCGYGSTSVEASAEITEANVRLLRGENAGDD